MKTAAIITAGGIGKRMGAGLPKQYLEVAGKPIIVHTIERFVGLAGVRQVIVTVPPGDETSFAADILAPFALNEMVTVVAGGAERQDSVSNGLAAVAGDIEIVLIHDGVRPFIKRDVIQRSIECARDKGACVVAMPLKETVKRVDEKMCVAETVDRSVLWGAQTPQAFRFDIIREAFDKATREGFYGTDDTMLVERLGHTVSVVEGDYNNIKITTAEDIVIAEAIARNWEE
jgi:2-C-methyl-D-erythritol 4-phosphate cytidylyltransferase